MSKYTVNYNFYMTGSIDVEANSLDEAQEMVLKDANKIPMKTLIDNAEYLDDSLEIEEPFDTLD